MHRFLALLLVGAAALAGAAAADTPTLQGNVGPGFSITLADASGNGVSHLDPGTYAVHVTDQADEHNFHLFGPGVDQATPVVGQGTFDWTVTLAAGQYRILCDAHPSTMTHTFTVGTPPAAVQVLKGSVGPGAKIAFARTVAVGKARITIRDLTARDNFHLFGPGVNRKTGVAFKGTVTWTVTLQAGRYTYRSDAHRALRGTRTVG